MINTKTTVKEIIQLFIDSILEPDYIKLSGLLSKNGTFDIQNSDLDTLEVGKDEFIEWIWIQRSFTNVKSVNQDQCLHCKVGAPTLLFEDGYFPRRPKDLSERSKTGLMLDIKDGAIHSIKFCYVFVKTDNKCMFELVHFNND